MSPRHRTASSDLPISPQVFYVLLAVAEQERHGYSIMQQVEARTEGRVRLLPGSLYSTLKRMLAADLISECESPDPQNDDARRRYYRITPEGRRVAEVELERIDALMEFAREQKLWPRNLVKSSAP